MVATRTPTRTLAKALTYLAQDIESEDGVANAAIAEAALRLQQQHALLCELRDSLLAKPTPLIPAELAQRLAELLHD